LCGCDTFCSKGGNIDLGCLRAGCLGEYLDLSGSGGKLEKTAVLMRSSVTSIQSCNNIKVIIENELSRTCSTHGREMHTKFVRKLERTT